MRGKKYEPPLRRDKAVLSAFRGGSDGQGEEFMGAVLKRRGYRSVYRILLWR